MTSIAASVGQVIFTPRDGDSYFYESFPCIEAQSSGYGGIRFSLQGPAGGSLALELQSSSSCNDSSTWKSSYNIVSDLTGQRQIVTMPLLGFDNDPNYDAVVGLVWTVFSSYNTQWSIGNITLVCGSVAGGTPSGPVTSMLNSVTLLRS